MYVHRMNAYDIETRIIHGVHSPIYVVLSNNDFYHHFAGKNAVCDSIIYLNKHGSGVYYIHNINFDGCLIIETLSTMTSKFEILMNGMNIYSIKCSTYEFRCSYKLLPQPLYQIGRSLVGLCKLPFPYKFADTNFKGNTVTPAMFNDNSEYDRYVAIVGNNSWDNSYIGVYCERDVLITLLFVRMYWNAMKTLCVKWPNTYHSASSISVGIFYKKMNTYNIHKYGCGVYDEYIRQSYYGGRCEIFGNPIENDVIHHFDYSGMYGQCMLEKYPHGNVWFQETCTDFDHPGFYRISWYSDSMYPVLPMHIEGKLMFCSGYGSGTYWYEEILLFIETGGKILKIHSAVLFSNMSNVLSDFVIKMNTIRSRGGEYKTIGKLLINSFYGRMGMSEKNDVWSVVDRDDTLSSEYIKRIDIGNISIVCKHEEQKNRTIGNISIAAATTAKARIKLYRGFQSVINAGGRILYCDTDSIFVSFKTSMVGSRIGDVCFDRNSILVDCVFALPKSYSILTDKGWSTRIKGFSRNSLPFNEFKDIFYNGIQSIQTDERSILRKNFILVDHVYKKILSLSTYKKRIFDNTKQNTRPIYMNEIHT